MKPFEAFQKLIANPNFVARGFRRNEEQNFIEGASFYGNVNHQEFIIDFQLLFLHRIWILKARMMRPTLSEDWAYQKLVYAEVRQVRNFFDQGWFKSSWHPQEFSPEFMAIWNMIEEPTCNNYQEIFKN